MRRSQAKGNANRRTTDLIIQVASLGDSTNAARIIEFEGMQNNSIAFLSADLFQSLFSSLRDYRSRGIKRNSNGLVGLQMNTEEWGPIYIHHFSTLRGREKTKQTCNLDKRTHVHRINKLLLI